MGKLGAEVEPMPSGDSCVTTDDGASDPRVRRKVQRKFVTVGFATLSRPDGFEVVCEAARSVGMEVRTYIRSVTIRAAIDDIAKARAARRPRKAG